ncbi:hypothetical protein [Rhodoferax antarcticus]|uniref:Uncharacterized protein n=1 Tax=Rhodoferax antarcticus ANT.BR TaxID=1111071 RepID=A0A1Q8Y9C9_9BURK|nr:hypothetical protein [Rhodoferax antarcticus]OLP04579.1 hypothetical protein BLL52_4318 [Rhodoferax antarcticus ANT.BR]
MSLRTSRQAAVPGVPKSSQTMALILWNGEMATPMHNDSETIIKQEYPV